MKEGFVAGVRVHFNISGGANAVIVHYMREGFYLIRTVPDQRELVAHEDDLVLGWRD